MGLIKVALILVIFTTLAYFVLPGNAAYSEMAKKSDLVSPIYLQDLNADEHKMKKFRGYGGGGGYGGYGYGHGKN
ncbi:hypothetical protein DAPPUDRAFT_314816 [Daphnia pulex]|uniref:Uncharacterized protein n=1 Tax=Daphnia pulex TaxID=6669 RepID=E9G7K4_DAPPU|nr:hypothetical protein DAPPUDRAFT_314816 [Daphnia pulex]|eukprot:EFX84482.1 hypothetical protein DAPPUDRAFT_314816 [Daphnia pulex]